MAPEWLWLGAAILGYAVAMVCNPLRSFLTDAYDLLRGRGHLRLWLPLALLSLVPVSFEWTAQSEGGASILDRRGQAHLVRAVSADGAGMFSSVVGLRAADAAAELPARTRAALSIGAVFWAAWAIGLQFFILVALYLRAVMPERDPGWKGLIDFAWRRTMRFWPGILIAGGVSVASLWLPAGGAGAVILWAAAALLAAVLAFLQVSLLSGDRGLGAAVRSNFTCWVKLPYEGFWFLVIVAVHLFLLRVSDASVENWIGDKAALGVAWDLAFALVRAVIAVWLLAALVLLYCAKTKNPSRRRIQP